MAVAPCSFVEIDQILEVLTVSIIETIALMMEAEALQKRLTVSTKLRGAISAALRTWNFTSERTYQVCLYRMPKTLPGNFSMMFLFEVRSFFGGEDYVCHCRNHQDLDKLIVAHLVSKLHFKVHDTYSYS